MTTTPTAVPRLMPRLRYYEESPDVFSAMRALQDAVDRSGLELSLLELVKLRVSQINGCAFCIDMHFQDAQAAGESLQRLFLLDAWEETDLYTARERAALHWAERLTRLPGRHVSDGDYADAQREFTPAELAQLTLAIVAINGWNRFGVGFRMPPGFAH